jgi:hypothetical protein
MDLRVYYQKIRDTRERLPEKDLVLMSCETQDGGKAGVFTETSRELAAKMLIDGTAVLATEEDAAEFRRALAAAKENADRELAASRVPLTVVSTSELNWLRSGREQD